MSIVEREIVSLSFFKPEYIPLLDGYQLHEEQKRFTAMPSAALQKCELEHGRNPVAIFYGDKLAGFFVLHGWDGVKDYHDNKDAVLLRAYSVNAAFQGKGIANHSMMLLPRFVREHMPSKNEIILAVNHANSIAQHVYRKAGFIDQGVRAIGREGEMLILHMEL